MVGIEFHGGLERRNGGGITALAHMDIAEADPRLGILLAGSGEQAAIDRTGFAKCSALEPIIGQKQPLIAGGVQLGDIAGLEESQGGMLKGGAAGKEVAGGKGVDDGVAIHILDGALGLVPGDRDGQDGRLDAIGRTGEAQKQGLLMVQVSPQSGLVGLNREQHPAGIAGGLAEPVGMDDAAGGEWSDGLDLFAGQSEAMGLAKGGDDGLVGGIERVRDDRDGVQGPANLARRRAGGGATRQNDQEKAAESPAAEVDAKRGEGPRPRITMGVYCRRVRSSTIVMPGVAITSCRARSRVASSGTAP